MSHTPSVSCESRHPIKKSELTPATGGNTMQDYFVRQLRNYGDKKTKQEFRKATIPVTPKFATNRISRRTDEFAERPTISADDRERSMSSSVSIPSQNTTTASSDA
ncbi:unnamed protein product [Bursaphelenchus okinawaensis]|uniref:Uncharacterized protein n=1 Tax=Bursaphelenchus okinawaensis TaxID=465554 RepID=A0A811KII6_9BILA|nr:unnamed protein product [Bursaphelenchus okinawaensis]CAG9103437.1 unnamed protein product [Bursaphelenchus okinawaensis]